jgi:hypothetical protein
MKKHLLTPLCAAAVAATLLAAPAPRANACGCFSPPVPESVDDSGYAINQQAEQIIFEVEEDHVTAHVSIRYAGDPESFAWIVPVPSVPDLDLSSAALFGLLDATTAPITNVRAESLCPDAAYNCTYHDPPTCPFWGNDGDNNGFSDSAGNNGANNGSWDAGADGSGGENPGGVVVHQREVVGSYDTVVFGAEEADGAVQWLVQEGFLVNESMAPFMQPYFDGGMLFIASKLIAGAGVEEIKPLKMTFQARNPMIPLMLTAVAAEPELTVTAYIYGDAYFAPVDHPILGVPENLISRDAAGRSNYPMVLSRLIDQAGGDGFMMEYSGAPTLTVPNGDSGCCDEWDNCGIQGDGQCQCPSQEWDRADCVEEGAEDLIEGLEIMADLQARYPRMTRLTTRLSPHEMTFDPMFAPAPIEPQGRLTLNGKIRTMSGCEGDIIDMELYSSIQELQGCSSVYCGAGTCATTADGPGCVCDPGFVSRTFLDLDGQSSVTCVPATPTVDHGAGGLDVPNICRGIQCGAGTCVNQNGFPACSCRPDTAATVVGPTNPSCRPIERVAQSPGAEDFTLPVEDVRACAPAPPECGRWGWLQENPNIRREGVLCESSLGRDEQFVVPAAPTCEEWYGEGYDQYDGYGDPNGDDYNGADPRDIQDPEDNSDDIVSCGACNTAGAPVDPTVPAALTLLLLGLLAIRARRA